MGVVDCITETNMIKSKKCIQAKILLTIMKKILVKVYNWP
jgi:hypothetical protein